MYVRTYTGKRVDVFNPHAKDICIEDIAHALTHTARFIGHTRRHYSVAEHSINVAWLVDRKHRAWALLHDAAEAYIGDLGRPIKHRPEMQLYRDCEANLVRVIAQSVGLPGDEPVEVRTADTAMLYHEAQVLIPFPGEDFDEYRATAKRFPAGAGLVTLMPRLEGEGLKASFLQQIYCALPHLRPEDRP